MTNIFNLPREIIVRICLFLPYLERFECPRINRTFKSSLEGNQYFWKTTYEQINFLDTPEKFLADDKNYNHWKQLVIDSFVPKFRYPYRLTISKDEKKFSRGSLRGWGNVQTDRFVTKKNDALWIWQVVGLKKSTSVLWGLSPEAKGVDGSDTSVKGLTCGMSIGDSSKNNGAPRGLCFYNYGRTVGVEDPWKILKNKTYRGVKEGDLFGVFFTEKSSKFFHRDQVFGWFDDLPKVSGNDKRWKDKNRFCLSFAISGAASSGFEARVVYFRKFRKNEKNVEDMKKIIRVVMRRFKNK